jgi:hypothetical protein
LLVSGPASDPVDSWIKQLDVGSHKQYRATFRMALEWLQQRPGLENITPPLLLRLQRANNRKQPTDEDPTPELTIPKLLKNWVNDQPVRLRTKNSRWAIIKSFFKYNDCPFPDPRSVNLRSDRAPSQSRLTIDIVRQAIIAAKLRDKSWLLVKWMSFQDQARLNYINRNLGGHIVQEMKAGKTVIRLDLLGRKKEKGKRSYFTFIGKDAVDALREYFDKERANGWPQLGEPIWLNNEGGPFAYGMYHEIWSGLLRRLGYIQTKRRGKGKAKVDTRYGYGQHEFRDVGISYLHTNAKREGLDLDCVHFMMGHTKNLDPNKYDRFYEDTNYGLEQYRIAEKYLNIMSGMASIEQERGRIRELEDRLAKLESVYTERLTLKKE